MSKRIEFIAPVEAMRGNLSGNQDLLYPSENNKAFESPVGSRNYANNYQPRFIGAKRAANNHKYFQIRTKSAIGMSTKSKMAMALLGGTGAMRAAIIKKTDVYENGVIPAYESQKQYGVIPRTMTLAKFIFETVYEALKAKENMIRFKIYNEDGYTTIFVRNPWCFTGTTGGSIVEVGAAVLVKFWKQLATNPIYFNIDGLKGVAHDGDTFDKVIASGYNVLGLDTETVGSTDYVKMGDGWLQLKATVEPAENWQYVEDAAVVSSDDSILEYRLTETAPEE